MLIYWTTGLLLFAAAGAAWSQEAADSPASTESASPPNRREDRDGWRQRDRRWSNWRDHRGSDDRRPWEHRGPRFERRPEHFVMDSGELVSGYVFIDGEYLPSPYRLQADGQGLRLNAKTLTLTNNADSAHDPHQTMTREWFYRLSNELMTGAVIVIESPADATTERTAQTIAIYPRGGTGAAILQQLTGDKTSPADEKILPKFLVSYQAPPDLIARAKEDLELIERSRTGAVADVTPLSNWAYPLTVLGMFLAAVAVGQLFVSRSLLSRPAVDDSPEITRAAVGCILVVAGLSVLDLIWTLLSVRAGIMQELNPLATQFLSSSLALTSFKIGITLCGATILYLCRYHRPAQLASWWLCMVCTLVTVRWVAFTSLFVT
jgi:hypothetical protein